MSQVRAQNYFYATGRKFSAWIILGACLVSLAIPVRANDTELTYGGTPRPLNGNTTVAMKRETVKIVVGEKWVTVDCRFTFENRGPARKVRMGFPDRGGEPDEDATGKSLPPKGTFRTFRSWVNGKLVPTSVIRGEDHGDVWHVKQVDFPANSTLDVRDRYVVAVGSSVAFDPLSVRLAEYVLHTGASWRGNIGLSEVIVTFRRKSVRAPLFVQPMPRIDDRGRAIPAWKLGARRVYYRGPSQPVVTGNRLRFARTDWRPTPKDDILLLFDLRQVREGNGNGNKQR